MADKILMWTWIIWLVGFVGRLIWYNMKPYVYRGNSLAAAGIAMAFSALGEIAVLFAWTMLAVVVTIGCIIVKAFF